MNSFDRKNRNSSKKMNSFTYGNNNP